MLLKRFPHHLGGESRFHVAKAFNRLVTVLNLDFVAILHRLGCQLVFQLGLAQGVAEIVPFLLH